MFRGVLIFLGRFFMSILFLFSAVNKIVNWQETESGFVSLLCDWHSYVSYSSVWQNFFALLLEWVPGILVVLVICELLGGLLVLLGIKVRFGAFLLILCFVPMTILVHQFWYLDGIRREMQLLIFMKNIAIIGGLFYIFVFGTKDKIKKKEPMIETHTFHDEPKS